MGAVQGKNACDDQSSAYPEVPGDWVAQEKDSHDRGKKGFTAQKETSFPAFAVLESLIHEKLCSKKDEDQQGNQKNISGRSRESWLGHEWGKSDDRPNEAEVKIDSHRSVGLPQFLDEAHSHPSEHAGKQADELPKGISCRAEVEQDSHPHQCADDTGNLQG